MHLSAVNRRLSYIASLPLVIAIVFGLWQPAVLSGAIDNIIEVNTECDTPIIEAESAEVVEDALVEETATEVADAEAADEVVAEEVVAEESVDAATVEEQTEVESEIETVSTDENLE